MRLKPDVNDVSKDKFAPLIIHAPNIHKGGGHVLLQALLQELAARNDCRIIVDSRCSIPQAFPKHNITLQVKPTFVGRLFAEWHLYGISKNDSIVLCLGNLPPIFRLKGHVSLFVQNAYLVSKTSVADFPWRDRLRICLERVWLRWFISRADEVIVQSLSMQRLVSRNFAVLPRLMPFMQREIKNSTSESVRSQSNALGKMYDFLYVASGEPHKNHHRLIEAWKILAMKNIFPSLCLTVPRYGNSALCEWLESQVGNHNLRIENIGAISSDQIQSLYLQAGALIYPSLLESLGLPLIEARRVGLPILASELDYVRDIVDPEQSFNPESAVSIARAVERFLGIEQTQMHVVGADAFIEYLSRKAQA